MALNSWLVKDIKKTDRNSVSIFYICLMLNEPLYQHKQYHQLHLKQVG